VGFVFAIVWQLCLLLCGGCVIMWVLSMLLCGSCVCNCVGVVFVIVWGVMFVIVWQLCL